MRSTACSCSMHSAGVQPLTVVPDSASSRAFESGGSVGGTTEKSTPLVALAANLRSGRRPLTRASAPGWPPGQGRLDDRVLSGVSRSLRSWRRLRECRTEEVLGRPGHAVDGFVARKRCCAVARRRLRCRLRCGSRAPAGASPVRTAGRGLAKPSAIQPMACPAQRQCCTRDRVDCERQHCPLLSLGLDDEPRERPDDRPQSAP
jgi:hypothetical protein